VTNTCYSPHIAVFVFFTLPPQTPFILREQLQGCMRTVLVIVC